jgi:predicted enzyme related to lactoylglutathione lyase
MKLIHEQIQYIEFLSPDLSKIKDFYQSAFGWDFVDYGPEYTTFSGENVEGGFAQGEAVPGSVLVILYSEDLSRTLDNIKNVGGSITSDIFEFPGGRRFHFADPDGNELAVWSEV